MDVCAKEDAAYPGPPGGLGRNYRQEIDEILRAGGRRKSASADETDRRGLYRRR